MDDVRASYHRVAGEYARHIPGSAGACDVGARHYQLSARTIQAFRALLRDHAMERGSNEAPRGLDSRIRACYELATERANWLSMSMAKAT